MSFSTASSRRGGAAPASAPARVSGGGGSAPPSALSAALRPCVSLAKAGSDSAVVNKLLPPWLAHLLCARCIRRRRKGCGTADTDLYWLNVDPCGLICAGMVYGLTLFSQAVVTAHVLGPWLAAAAPGAYAAHAAAFNGLGVLTLLCHMRAMLSNPGAVPAASRPAAPAGWDRVCSRCDNHKPERAHHCSICNRCVIKMDHHCPWINNCVGLANHKFFVLFVMYIFCLSLYALALIGGRAWACAAATGPPAAVAAACGAPLDVGALPLVLAVVAIAALFALFTCCLLVDQATSIATARTAIDRWKERAARDKAGGGGSGEDDAAADAADERRRFWANLGEVFGGNPAVEGPRLTWLLPTAISYPDPEGITGFCFRDVPRPRTIAQQEELV
jgi:palmitoyltransferase